MCSCSIRVSRRIGARLAAVGAGAFRGGGAAEAVAMPMTMARTPARNAPVKPKRLSDDAACRRGGGESPLNRGELRMLLAGRNRLGPGPVAGLLDFFGQFPPGEPLQQRVLRRSVQSPPPLPARPSPLSQVSPTSPNFAGAKREAPGQTPAGRQRNTATPLERMTAGNVAWGEVATNLVADVKRLLA